MEPVNLDTSRISDWRSIVTLVVFIVTNITVLFPFHLPIFIPRPATEAIRRVLVAARVLPSNRNVVLNPRRGSVASLGATQALDDEDSSWTRFNFPFNIVTAPLIADLFLLAILAIGRREVHDGTIGANNISPLDIMAFFITLAYIAISIDASGLIRYLAFRVLKWGGKVGHRLFFCLYVFFFLLGTFTGNDPVILSGTAFLSYMTRVSSNIIHPRAWIYTQFAIANIASAILVSSNPTNLVLAGAFKIKFIVYSANMIVPVVVTAIVLFPFLLYIVFANESLIPTSIEMHELPAEAREKAPVNPNIRHARGQAEEDEQDGTADRDQRNRLSLEEIMNPFLDKSGAAFGATVMAITLITLLALNAAAQEGHEYPVFYVTLPGAFVSFCWDVAMGWRKRHETREIARKGREEVQRARAARAIQETEARPLFMNDEGKTSETTGSASEAQVDQTPREKSPHVEGSSVLPRFLVSEPSDVHKGVATTEPSEPTFTDDPEFVDPGVSQVREHRILREIERQNDRGPATLVSLASDAYRWTQDTFPAAVAVLSHLPFALVPFALAMFVLVQALVTKGWVPVFAHGWDHWVSRTGTVGAVGGMGFLSVVLSNFAGTNIGTTILLSRVIQAWQEIHRVEDTPITDRTFWATVYSMALGVNYGAFSTAFSASLAGLLWRDILARKHIHVRGLDFARINLPIIAIAMAVGCAVLVGEIYIIRDNSPYKCDLNA